MIWRKYTFADGYIEIVRGYDDVELAHMIAKHGKIISVEQVKV